VRIRTHQPIPKETLPAGATAWILAFNARWEVAMPAGEGATTTLVRERQLDFLDLSW
jgi:hypothetical protein